MFIVIILIILVLSRVLASPVVKGRIGEAKIAFLLNRLDREQYYIMNDVLLPSEKGTAQVDHIVISIYGVFVIETKNYKGWIYGSERSKSWTQVIYKRKHKFMNPIHQNYGHVKALENVLGKTYTHPFCSIISFSQKATLKEISIASPLVHVVHSVNLLKTIKMYDERLISNANMKGIIYKLRHFNIEGKEERKNHVRHIKETKEMNRIKVEKMECPKCGGVLIHRIGKHGSFKGCRNYPKCRFVYKKSS